MRVAYAVAIVVGSGCAQILGIDDTTSPSTSLDLQRVSIGAAVVTAPLELGAATPMFLVADAIDPSTVTSAAATRIAPGQWGTPVANPIGVIYTAPDLPTPFQHEIAPITDVTSASFIAFEHPNAQPAPMSSLMLNVTLPDAYAAAQTLEVTAIGAWTQHVLVGAELPMVGANTISTTLTNTSFTATTASPPARIAMGDVVLVLRYAGADLTGMFQVPSFDQTDGIDVVTGTMTEVAPTTSLLAMIDPTTIATRFGALQPAESALSISWRLDAAPGYTSGVTTGIELAAGAIAMTDQTIVSNYDNPFASLHWQPMLSYVSSETRIIALGGATVALSASLSSIVDPGPALSLDVAAGLPTMIMIDQTQLTDDGMTLTLDPTVPHQIDLIPDITTNTLYQVTVDEIAVVGTSVSRTSVITVSSPVPQVTLPPHVFQANHTYTLATTCIAGGYPNAATGDLRTFALPVSFGQADSAVFTIVAP